MSPMAQGPVLMMAMELMEGGSLRAALVNEDLRERLRWHERCAATRVAPGFCGRPCLPPDPTSSFWRAQHKGLAARIMFQALRR
jgi:hypothetical protein